MKEFEQPLLRLELRTELIYRRSRKSRVKKGVDGAREKPPPGTAETNTGKKAGSEDRPSP